MAVKDDSVDRWQVYKYDSVDRWQVCKDVNVGRWQLYEDDSCTGKVRVTESRF